MSAGKSSAAKARVAEAVRAARNKVKLVFISSMGFFDVTVAGLEIFIIFFSEPHNAGPADLAHGEIAAKRPQRHPQAQAVNADYETNKNKAPAQEREQHAVFLRL